MRSLKLTLRAAAAVAAAAALAGGAAAMSGCGGSSVDPVAQAATTTAQQRGAQFAMTISFTLPRGGQRLSMPGSGVVDVQGKRADIRFDLSNLSALTGGQIGSGAGATLEEILIYPTAYLRAPFLASSVPAHKPWIKYDVVAAAKRATGVDPTQLTTQNSPVEQVQQLRGASGDVQRVGSEVIRGVQTTHYRGTVDLRKLAGSAARQAADRLKKLTGRSTYPFDVWIDAQRRVRRENSSFDYKVGSQSLSLAVSIDLFGYGPPPAITAPPADQVFDATGQTLGGS